MMTQLERIGLKGDAAMTLQSKVWGYPLMNSEQQPSPIPGSRRGKPGRPPTGDQGIFARPELGHKVGTLATKQQAGSGENGSATVSLTVAPCHPRLLDLHGAAQYLGVSVWTILELEAAGTISRVRIPLPNHNELRKLLFCKEELDRLVDSWKDSAS